MKIYFSGSIGGGRKYEPVYIKIVDHLQNNGHCILSIHVARPDMLPEKFNDKSSKGIYRRDIQWIEQCDILIAEVSNPSLGVGYEICYGLLNEKPVLCLYESGINISQMILGNDHPNISIHSYKSVEELKLIIDKVLSRLA